MRKQFLLTGDNAISRAEGGTVELYAVRLQDGQPQGRLHHFKTAKDGAEFACGTVKTHSADWACMAKCARNTDCVSVSARDASLGDTNEFARFIKVLEKRLEKDSELFEKRGAYSRYVLKRATARLAEVNTRLSKWYDDDFDDTDEAVGACKVLCNYLKVEARIPTKDIAGDFSNIIGEILHLSGVRYKDVSLPEDWWKRNNGAMLGYLEDGTPVALLPSKLLGYRMYDPKRNKTVKVNADEAAKIKLHAIAVFRTFPTQKIGFKDIVGFILGESIYKEIAVILLCSFLANVIQVIPPLVSRQVFDVIVPENLRNLLFEVILILIAFGLANIGFMVIMNLGVSRINTKCGLSVQAALWDRLLSLRIPFFNKFTTGELLQKIKGIDQVSAMISMQTLQVIFSSLFSFVNLIVLIRFNADITRYVLMMFLCLFAVHIVAWRKKYRLYKSYTDLENKAMSFNHQCVRGIHRVKTSCAEERVFNIWSAYEADKRSVKSRIKMIDNALVSLQLFFDFASTAAVYFMIAQIHDVAMGMFIAYISTFLLFQQAMRKLLAALHILPEFIAVCMNIKPILDSEPEYGASKTIPKDMDGTLEINHAVFRYGEYGRAVLNDISFCVEEGESVGIVGLSGGGKSTLVKVMMGFYDLAGGKIYYGGYDLETIDLRYLRKQMGVVMQNGIPTVGDIYSNVTNNDDSVEYAAVVEAVRKVGLDETVAALPNGLHTRLEDCSLSDGERQRLLIARAIAKKNKFIFMDEATSSLDNISQGMILKNLKNIPSTKIIIAQRLATVRYCDKIIVMANGKIDMQGSYDYIVKNHALFRQ